MEPMLLTRRAVCTLGDGLMDCREREEAAAAVRQARAESSGVAVGHAQSARLEKFQVCTTGSLPNAQLSCFVLRRQCDRTYARHAGVTGRGGSMD